MDHITILHGIHEGLTNPGWTNALRNRLELTFPELVTETEKYAATAFPHWNVYVKNPRYAKFHANIIEGFSRAYTRNRMPDAPPSLKQLHSFRIHLVAHSNGTDIARQTVLRLAKRGLRVETVILVSAAIESDVRKSGLEQLVQEGSLRRVIAYCNDDDPVIYGLQWLPGAYGSLGTRGFQRGKEETGLKVLGFDTIEGWDASKHRFITRWFHGFNHSGVLSPENYEETFSCFERDIGLFRGV